jgi:hypothetical protein
MKKRVLLLAGFLFIVSSVLFAQPTVTVKTYGVSPRDVAKDSVEHYFNVAYNGLQNVGKEVKVYLEGTSSVALNGATFTFSTKPAGSNATFSAVKDVDSSTQIISFIPDSVGTYDIEFANAGQVAIITINTALYYGVDGGPVSCKTCHGPLPIDYPGVYTKWAGTAHASAMKDGVDGVLSSHFQELCLTCHTTGYIPSASNNGFDDFPFTFPQYGLHAGNYDSLTAAYPDAMQRANVQCEACHGPGSGHQGNLQNSRMVKTLDYKNCAYCHDSGTYYILPNQWEHSGEDASEFDGRGFEGGHAKGAYIGYAGGTKGCSPCHSGAGYVQWVKENRPLDANGLPNATLILPEATNISCAVCHDPHDATNLHQLRSTGGQLGDGTPYSYALYGAGAQCMDCHRSRRYAKTYAEDVSNQSTHYGAHHGPQADMLLGKNAPDFGMQLPSSPHAVAGGNACVDCHMAGPSFDSQGNISVVGGHSWNMNDAEGHDNVEACAQPGCHGNIGTSFSDKKYYINGNADLDGNGVAEGLQVEVHGLLTKLGSLLPHDATGAVSIANNNADSTTLTPAIMKAGYVYFWVEEDRSLGIHNPAFTVSLLKASIEIMGGVTSVEYPKDNAMPDDYQLSQNYPNPFNPSTTIKFSLPTDSKVKVVVYNLTGEVVKVLADGEYAAGNHETQFNTNSVSGLASGIYFYQINAVSNNGGANFTQTKKMVLLK